MQFVPNWMKKLAGKPSPLDDTPPTGTAEVCIASEADDYLSKWAGEMADAVMAQAVEIAEARHAKVVEVPDIIQAIDSILTSWRQMMESAEEIRAGSWENARDIPNKIIGTP